MRKLKVLLVDDDINLANFICSVLETDYNYGIHFQNTALGINHIIQSLDPDIIILDVEVGADNGIEVAKEIFKSYPDKPLIFISSHTEESLIAAAISAGGNAYLSKPISIPILVSYIKRFTSDYQTKQILKLLNYELNLVTNELKYNKNLIKKLSPFEKNSMELLMNNPNKIVSREQFAQKLWGQALKDENIASIHNTISKLRDLLKNHNNIKINTIRNTGYILQYQTHINQTF